jgi:hypothetical protein
MATPTWQMEIDRTADPRRMWNIRSVCARRAAKNIAEPMNPEFVCGSNARSNPTRRNA